MKNKYKEIFSLLERRIIENQYINKIPNERSLCTEFNVTRNTIKKAISQLIDCGLIINNPGSGNFINQFIKENYESYQNQLKGRIGLSNVYNYDKHQIISKVLQFNVIKASTEVQMKLLLEPDEFVYEIERVRYLDNEPFSIELSYIPIKFLPNLTISILKASLYNHIKEDPTLRFVNSYLSFSIIKSDETDSKHLSLELHEPLSLMEEVIILKTGNPFQFSKVKQPYNKFIFHYTQKHI